MTRYKLIGVVRSGEPNFSGTRFLFGRTDVANFVGRGYVMWVYIL